MTWPCVLPHRHDPDRPRPVEPGLLVCRGCVSSLEQALAELPAQFRGLSLVLAAGGSTGAKVSGSSEARLPINPTVAELREDIDRKLVSWAMMIAEERGDHTPCSNNVEVVACWLLVRLRWACAQPWVDQFAAELVGYESAHYGRWIPGLRSRALALLFPSGRRRIVVGSCVEAGCPGTLTATVARTDDVLPSSVDCDVDETHTWSSSQWPVLGRRLHGPAGYETRAAAAFLAMLEPGRMTA
jgi:hypothetical protein